MAQVRSEKDQVQEQGGEPGEEGPARGPEGIASVRNAATGAPIHEGSPALPWSVPNVERL